MDQPGERSRSAQIVARPGGAMTDEVGTVTGDLTLRAQLAPDGTLTVLVQYTGADEWYRLSDAPTALAAGETLDDLLARLVAAHGEPPATPT